MAMAARRVLRWATATAAALCRVAAGPPYAVLPKELSPTATFTLRDEHKMPIVGLGVYQTKPGKDTFNSVKWSLQAGYRLVDTAALYGNEADVGRAVKESGIPRSEIFVATKLWDPDHGYDEAVEAFEGSLENLGLDYVDLYLIHSPNTGKLVETWDALVAMQRKGKIRSIGVSNFGKKHIEALRKHGRPLPAVNQIELHPLNYRNRASLLDYCKENGILVQAYGSLFAGQTEWLKAPQVTSAVKAHPGKTPAQVLLRWALQMGIQVIPKSVKHKRIEENLKFLDFELSESEMAALSGMKGELQAYWQPLGAKVDLGDTSRGGEL